MSTSVLQVHTGILPSPISQVFIDWQFRFIRCIFFFLFCYGKWKTDYCHFFCDTKATQYLVNTEKLVLNFFIFLKKNIYCQFLWIKIKYCSSIRTLTEFNVIIIRNRKSVDKQRRKCLIRRFFNNTIKVKFILLFSDVCNRKKLKVFKTSEIMQ